ncbi:hypothetical protein LPB138_04070 [Urechidicola croceus]|uniref:OmpA-like domain-containing protein n=2 Tax=Urechidicola croceus TaxID=1850246 RepID=A0A1D8P5T5_9FLAO|nr:hypothetical protein LPB138_04070 [Urechidicola croceus]
MVLFASSKKDKNLKRRDRSHNRMEYLEFYKGLIGDDGQIFGGGRYSYEKFNMFYESDITFSPDGKTIFFTLNNYIDDEYRERFNKSETKEHVLSIYRANIDDAGIATNIKSLPINNNDYSVRNPELSPDGKTLYYSSTNPEGYGDYDIYKIAINDDGTYGKEINLGPEINSKDNEFFPFMSTNNILYFSSDGHGGIGFLDIFSSTYENGEYATPTNLGGKINSEYDDFAFIVSPERHLGYFSSSRQGKGDADIYSFQVEPLAPIACNQTINGIVRNELTDAVITNTTVQLFSNGTPIETVTTDSSGLFTFDVDCETNYTIIVSKNAHSDSEKTFTTSDINNETSDFSFFIQPLECKQTIAGIVISKETKIPLLEVELSLFDGKKLIESTNSKIGGVFNFETKIDCKSNYTVIAGAKNYLPLTTDVKTTDVLNEENYLKLALEEAQEFVTIRNIVMIRSKPIYFDLNDSSIRKDAAIELDKVVEIMKNNPEIKIEINSHTDSRAADEYNLRLSDDRSKSTIAYIISQGIEAYRLSGQGYGETQLVNKCSNGVKCSEAEHQENRRTEFIVINE